MSKPKRGIIPKEEEAGLTIFWIELVIVSALVSIAVNFLYNPIYSPFAFFYSGFTLYVFRKFLKEESRQDFEKKFTIVIFTFVLTFVLFFLHKELIIRIFRPTDLSFVYFSFPFAFGALVLAFLFESIVPINLTLLIALGIFGISGNPVLLLFALVTGFAAIYGIIHYSKMKRGSIYRSTFIIVFPLTFLFMLLLNLFPIRIQSIEIALGASILNVLELSVLGSFLIPVIEFVFKVVSPLRLIELANTNLEIFKKMAIEAPGTFHHSLMVATLAERAADTIGANSLLAKVGALYHDIGKLKMPQYFTENQVNIPNPHEGKSPTLSSLIIINHVKEGVEMGKNLGLPQEIIDFIAQHHGTTYVKYFYLKAKEMNMEVDDSAFRYPGPKPQSKETAIVMICDGAEAAVKSLEEADEEAIKETVEKIVKYLVDEGQFDEAPITLKEIGIVKNEIVKILSAIYHKRIEYPEEGKINDFKQAEEVKNK